MSSDEHSRCEMRLDEIRDVVERFTYDLGLLIAGQPATFLSSADPLLASRLRSAVAPFLASGDAMRPDFGAYGELHVEGDLLAIPLALTATLEFDDHCIRETQDGALTPSSSRRVRLVLGIGDDPCRVRQCTLRRLP